MRDDGQKDDELKTEQPNQARRNAIKRIASTLAGIAAGSAILAFPTRLEGQYGYPSFYAPRNPYNSYLGQRGPYTSSYTSTRSTNYSPYRSFREDTSPYSSEAYAPRRYASLKD